MTRHPCPISRGRPLLAWVVSAGCLAAAFTPASAQEASDGVSCRITAARNRVYVRELVSITVTIESRGLQVGSDFNLSGLPPDTVLQLGEFRELQPQKIREGNVLRELRQFRCDAQALTAGSITVAPRLQLSVWRRISGFFGSAWTEQRADIPSEPLQLDVLPLPDEGRPPDFRGAVGQFEMTVKPPSPAAVAGELVTLQSTISGRGYIPPDDGPLTDAIASVRLYPGKRVRESPDEHVYEQVVVPLTTNATAIPAQTFTFFNPFTARYETRRQGPFPLHVRPDTAVPMAQPAFRPPSQGAGVAATPRPAQDGMHRRWSMQRAYPSLGSGIMLAGILLAVVSAGLLVSGIRIVRTDVRRGRRVMARHAALAALGAAITVGGYEWHERMQSPRSGARLARDVSARLGPSTLSAPLFDLTAGTDVDVRESFERWVRVQVPTGSGWVTADALTRAPADDNGVAP